MKSTDTKIRRGKFAPSQVELDVEIAWVNKVKVIHHERIFDIGNSNNTFISVSFHKILAQYPITAQSQRATKALWSLSQAATHLVILKRKKRLVENFFLGDLFCNHLFQLNIQTYS